MSTCGFGHGPTKTPPASAAPHRQRKLQKSCQSRSDRTSCDAPLARTLPIHFRPHGGTCVNWKSSIVVISLFSVSVIAAPAPKTKVAHSSLTPAELQRLAHAFYEWRDREDPVNSSDQGKHIWDDKLTDFSSSAIASRAAHVARLLERVRAADVSKWDRDDVVDWLLFRSQLERMHFGDRVLKSESTNPQVYPGVASNA